MASSSARRIGALISGLQGKVQEAQRHQLQARAETLHQDELGNISISAKIGAGGFGACYRGLYQGTEAAIKVVHDRHGSATEVFRNAVELAVLSTLSHPNIVQVLTYFTDVGVSYPSADDLMTTPEAAPRWPAIYQTLLELALALRYLHSLSLVHRDVKLQNVLLKSHSNDPRGFTCKLSGAAGVDSSMDIWAFGVCMWELATGRAVYGALMSDAIIRQVTDHGMRPMFDNNTPQEYRQLAAR
ncbi:predicted protein [Haematococcus lacustris]|uniref:Protein kinase domain-containing protein n=1 Tax=Haematococcus lacustris TaxID=44745 RepID=A0A699YY66_HAELA|nr:predicted protein [Haematococcus lacustris]